MPMAASTSIQVRPLLASGLRHMATRRSSRWPESNKHDVQKSGHLQRTTLISALSAKDQLQLRSRTLSAIPGLNARSLVELVRAAARSSGGCVEPQWDEVWSAMGSRATELLPEISLTDLAALWSSHVEVGWHAPSLFDAIAHEAHSTLQRDLYECRPSDVASLAHSAAFMGTSAPALFQAIGTAAALSLSVSAPSTRRSSCSPAAMRPVELTTIMWAAAAADAQAPELFNSSEFATFIAHQTHERGWSASDLSRMHQWRLWRDECAARHAGERDAAHTRTYDLPTALRERCHAAFASVPASTSQLQAHVADALDCLGLPVEREVRLCKDS
jgi:hypothetical protein